MKTIKPYKDYSQDIDAAAYDYIELQALAEAQAGVGYIGVRRLMEMARAELGVKLNNNALKAISDRLRQHPELADRIRTRDGFKKSAHDTLHPDAARIDQLLTISGAEVASVVFRMPDGQTMTVRLGRKAVVK